MKAVAVAVAVAALLAAFCGTLPAGAQSTPPTTDLYDEAHYERVGHLIYGYQRMFGMLDDAARADLVRKVPPELGARLRQVFTEYDAIVQEHGDVPDARIDAAMRTMSAVHAELAALNIGEVK